MEIYRRMSGRKRLELAFQMGNSLRRLSAEGVRSRHPEYTAEQVKLAVIRLTLGDVLFRQVYGSSYYGEPRATRDVDLVIDRSSIFAKMGAGSGSCG